MRQFVRYRIVSFSRPFQSKRRWALNFDGVGVRGQLVNRAINVEGDIDIEFYTPDSFTASSVFIVSQTNSGTNATREFGLWAATNSTILAATVGGTAGTIFNVLPNTKYRVLFTGSTVTLYSASGQVLVSKSFPRGAVREPSAVTTVGAVSNGSGGFNGYFRGVQRDVKINGVRWPMADYNQAIQLPQPSGLGAELFANPSLSNEASGWGRINATAVNEGQFLRLINTTPAAGFIFQTITTVAGVKYVVRVNSAIATGTALRITINSGGSAAYTGSISNKNIVASEIGQQLFLEFEAISSQTTIGFFVNGATVGNSVVISKVEVKPLGTCNPMTISNAASTNWMQVVDDYVSKFRKVLRLDGIGVRGVTGVRAINPDGDIDIEWTQQSQLKADGNVIVAQCIHGTNINQEFRITERADGVLELIVGGAVNTAINAASGYERNGKYRLVLVGNTLSFYKNGAVLVSTSFTRGTAREPSAVTQIGVRGESSKINYFIGLLYNVKINGTLWPIADSTQSIQLPEPSGLGVELITPTVLENPQIVNNQWTYLGDGRWQYIGNGSANVLAFIGAGSQPSAGFVEFEVESISGGVMRCSLSATVNNASDPLFSTTGIKRYFFTSRDSTNAFQFARNTSTAITCIIKNISFKELGTLNATELVANGTFNAGTAGWSPQGGGIIEVVDGQLLLTILENQNSRLDKSINVVGGAYYRLSIHIVGFTGIPSVRISVIRGAAGNYAQIASRVVNVNGVMSVIFMSPSTDCIIQVSRDGNLAGTVTVDNISLMRYEGLCNPITLTNVTSANWEDLEI